MSLPPLPPPIDPLIRARRAAGAPPSTLPTAPAKAPTKRSPPARRSKVASTALSIAATIGLTAAFARANAGDAAAADGADSVGSTGPAVSPSATFVPSAPGGATVTTVTPAAGASAQPTVAIADGAYTGDTFTNRWGPVQVQVVYAAGSITDVVVLRYPDGDRKSVSINQRALPRYEASAIAAQGADISRISGATYTWRDYRRSLQSAIDAAVAASSTGG